MRPLRKLLKWGALASLALIALCIIPVTWVETQCVKPRRVDSASFHSLLPENQRRNFVDTFLTYPEWSIVHSYEDFAAVIRDRGEAAFDYTGHIAGYWTNLCQVYGYATERGAMSLDVRAMLHIIGISFSAEMALKGLWENTIGRLSALLSFGESPEDRFSHSISSEYASFLVQTPWYEYPFASRLASFWSSTPFGISNPVRMIERRIALSMEWGVKALYAQGMGMLAGLSPSQLSMMSVVRTLDESDIAADSRIKLVERLPNGDSVIETPRYRAFTEVLSGLTSRGRDFVEIAGNTEILVTVIVAPATDLSAFGPSIIAAQAQAWPGMERRGLLVPVVRLRELNEKLKAMGGRLEHAYDY